MQVQVSDWVHAGWKRAVPPSEVEQVKKASTPSELVERVLMVGVVVVEETTELEEEAAIKAWAVSLLGEAMVEEVNWCRRHSHLQNTSS